MEIIKNDKKIYEEENFDIGKMLFSLIHGLLSVCSFFSLVFSFMVYTVQECLPLEARFILLFGLSFLILNKYFKKLISRNNSLY